MNDSVWLSRDILLKVKFKGLPVSLVDSSSLPCPKTPCKTLLSKTKTKKMYRSNILDRKT